MRLPWYVDIALTIAVVAVITQALPHVWTWPAVLLFLAVRQVGWNLP
jgi:hypothetical protein